MNKSTLFAAVIIGSAALVGSLQAAPSKHDTATLRANHLRVAAAEKREVEGTKADIKEDQAEAKAMTHHRIKHHRYHKVTVHKM